MQRMALNALYRATEALGAVCLALVGVMILSQIIGRNLGILIPSADEIAGYFMAASAFLLLGPNLRQGVHVRVGLLIERLTGQPRRWLEIICLLMAVALSLFLAWNWAELVWDSFDLDEKSQGLLPIPLWLPQAAMGLGLAVLVIVLLDELVTMLMGRQPSYTLASVATEG